jgi:hypothetical protein
MFPTKNLERPFFAVSVKSALATLQSFSQA